MLTYLIQSFRDAVGQLGMLFGWTFALAYLLHLVSSTMRGVGQRRLGLTYYFLVAPGVACHETGHALGFILTGTRILEYAPFRPQPNGVLGWVKPDPRDLEGVFGRAKMFVAATGPVWFGGAVILVLLRFLTGVDASDALRIPAEEMPEGVVAYAKAIWQAVMSLAARLLVVGHWNSLFDLVLAYLVLCIGSEISLSVPDLSGMLLGLGAICTIVIVANCIPVVDLFMSQLAAWLRPHLFHLHATLALVFLIDLALCLLFLAADSLFATA